MVILQTLPLVDNLITWLITVIHSDGFKRKLVHKTEYRVLNWIHKRPVIDYGRKLRHRDVVQIVPN